MFLRVANTSSSVILTDNGSEFSNPKENKYRKMAPYLRTRTFYCDADSLYQKGSCEVNHELIRCVLPKGSSFDNLTQKDLFLMMDHINSYNRKKLYYEEDLFRKLGCSPVAAENNILKPKLLKSNREICISCQKKTTPNGWILRMQKFREGIDLWFLYANFLLNVL